MRHITTACLAALALSATTAHAAFETKETLVHDTTTRVNIDLDAQTVLCSSADYGALFLKVLIPELAALTLLDHQNLGAGAPCVASGLCAPGNMPDDIIDASCPTEDVDINVKAVRLDEIDTTAQTCATYLIERVHVAIRGIDFQHERSAPLGSRPFSDCVAAAPTAPSTGETDAPADAPGTAIDPETGGCSTGRGAGWGLALLGLAACRTRRRRGDLARLWQ